MWRMTFMDMRKQYEELSKRPVPDETMPSGASDSAGLPANDANPADREDLRSLLNAAARSSFLYTETGQTTTGYTVFSQTTSTALAQSAIRKLSVRSISPMDTYELSDVERKMIIWALQELVRLYRWHDV
jgi:hypothetical protein